MNKLKNRLSGGVELMLLALMLGLGSMALSGCEEGPVEEAGEEVDETLDDVGDEIE